MEYPKDQPTAWSCKKCKTTDLALKYTGKEPLCKDCKRFANIEINATRKRKRVAMPKLEFNRDEFLAWCRAKLRACVYCGVTDAQIAQLGLRTQIGRKLDALGIDRINSERPYRLDNIGLCCFACNKAKGNVFSDTEMRLIGKSIADVWQLRLKASSNN